jgi:DNA-binding transcriptional ArsR family regulator
VLRLELNQDDLARLRLAASWGPFSETYFSVPALRSPQPARLVDGWQQAVRKQVEPVAGLSLLTSTWPIIDLHTVVGTTPSIDEALDRLAAAPGDQLRRELEPLLALNGKVPSWARAWVRDLSDGDQRARRALIEQVRAHHQRAIEPYWADIDCFLDAEKARRQQIMDQGGVDMLLATLHPMVRWRPPVLEIDTAGGRRVPDPEPDRLDGRSLVLVPSVFCLDAPHVLYSTRDESLPRLLVYPALRTIDDAISLWTGAAPPGRRALAKLLGATRAAALDAIADTCTTTELAQRIGVSTATASHHASVLREAGLTASRRLGSTVLHRITPRGALLLNGNGVRPDGPGTREASGRAPTEQLPTR